MRERPAAFRLAQGCPQKADRERDRIDVRGAKLGGALRIAARIAFGRGKGCVDLVSAGKALALKKFNKRDEREEQTLELQVGGVHGSRAEN